MKGSNIITFTKSNLPYGWMGNMAGYFEGKPLTIEYENKLWKTSENLFQAMRFEDIGIQGLIRRENGFNGKKVAKRFKDDMTVKPLSRQDVLNMVKCVQLKVEQHPELKQMLIETGDKTIIEDVTYRIGGTGMFWGSAKLNQHWIGNNVLGVIWMYIRDDIQSQESVYGNDEEELLEYIFEKFMYSDVEGYVECINTYPDVFIEGETYPIIDETKEHYFIRDEFNQTRMMYKKDYGSILKDDIFDNMFKIKE
jgi:predicted NAD-dependent protein-ADP-ribosyltransferase YbiA (DUF1768 family)